MVERKRAKAWAKKWWPLSPTWISLLAVWQGHFERSRESVRSSKRPRPRRSGDLSLDLSGLGVLFGEEN